MKNLIPILTLFIYSTAYGQFDIDLEFDYTDFLKKDSTRNYSTVRFYDQKFKEGKEPYTDLSEELIFNTEGSLIERYYFCGKTSCDTMKFKVNEYGESILIEDTFDDIIIPWTERPLSYQNNISLEYDNRMRLCSIIYVDSKKVEKMKLEYSYDSDGRIIECKRFYGGVLKLITTIEYNT